jgi:hypothetical protein
MLDGSLFLFLYILFFHRGILAPAFFLGAFLSHQRTTDDAFLFIIWLAPIT